MSRLEWPPLAVVVLLLAACTASPRVAAPDLVLENVMVVDVAKGRILGPHSVSITDGKIAWIGPPDAAWPPTAKVVDGGGRYLAPGLWDMHVHWYDEASLALFPLNGVTGVRIMRGEPVHYAWRARAIEGSPDAPRMYLASPLVDGSPPTSLPAFEVSTPDQAREVVGTVARSAADFLKVYDKVPREAYLALVEEAARQGVRVEGHVPIEVSWDEAASLGQQRSFEHLHSLPIWTATDSAPLHRRWMEYYREVDYNQGLGRDDRLESASIHADAYDAFDPERWRELAGVLAGRRIWQSPTCILWQAREAKSAEEYANDPRMRRVPGWMRDWWGSWMSDDPEVRRVEGLVNRRRVDYCLQRVRDMAEAGVPLLAGTDVMMPFVFPGTGLHDELALMVRAGLTPAQALATATTGPAEFMGRVDIGRIEVGALADLVLLEDDPLRDIGAISRIRGVVAGGKWLGPEERAAAFARIERVIAAPAASTELATTLSAEGLDAALARHGLLCPADPEVRDCNAINIAFELSMALAAQGDSGRQGELVDWIVATYPKDPDALFWAHDQYASSGRDRDARRVLGALLGVAPGFALALEDGRIEQP